MIDGGEEGGGEGGDLIEGAEVTGSGGGDLTDGDEDGGGGGDGEDRGYFGECIGRISRSGIAVHNNEFFLRHIACFPFRS